MRARETRVELTKQTDYTDCELEPAMTFEQIFKIVPEHSLREEVGKRRNKAYADRWFHEEFDSGGSLVARYESWADQAPRVKPIVGWRKLGPDGTTLEEHDDLPL